jgi:hypothetical protein
LNWPGADLVHFEAQPSLRSLRGFGFVALVVFGYAGFRLEGSLGGALAALGAFAGLCSLARPRWNRPLYLALSALTFPLAWLSAWLMLLGVFYLVVTPCALAYRAFGRRDGRETGSAWHPARKPGDKSSYFRQF